MTAARHDQIERIRDDARFAQVEAGAGRRNIPNDAADNHPAVDQKPGGLVNDGTGISPALDPFHRGLTGARRHILTYSQPSGLTADFTTHA